MGIHRGPNIITEDLVFGYDSGYGVADNDTATRFYAGKPITNYLSSGVSNYNVVQAAAWSGATPTFTLGTSEFGTPIGTYTVASTSYMYSYDQVLDDDLSTLSGQAITFSIYLKRQGANANVGIRVYDNVSGYTTVYAAATSKFQRFTLTKTLGANPTRIFVMIDNTNGGVIDFHSPQLEIGTVSPFVDGTRSDTASLIDLKRTTSIDVSNVSFDSTGQPTFDGTNDVITTSFPATTIPNVTIEAVVYRNQATTRYEAIVQNNNASDDALYVNPSGVLMFWPCGSSSLTVPTGQWSHVAVSYNGTTLTYIVNGTTQVVTATCTDITDWDFLRIGGHGTTDGERWIGKIAVAKVYEKSLSAAELTQNYNAYKNRFDI